MLRTGALARELQIALHTAIDEKAEAAIALCLWACARPREAAPTLSMASSVDSDEDDAEDRFEGWTAVAHAVLAGNLPLLKRFGPTSELDDFDSLHSWARDPAILDYLFSIQVPTRPASWIVRQIQWASLGSHGSWSLLTLFERAFANGLRWTEATDDEVATIRRSMLGADSNFFRRLLRLMCQGGHCSGEVLQAIARTPAFQRRMREEGYLPSAMDTPFASVPTGRREVQARLGMKSKPSPPSLMHIGGNGIGGREIISRRELFEKVWTTPMRVLAKQWRRSDRGIAKACARAQVPVPPRGYWARVEAGQNVKQPKLPAFKGPREPRIEVPRTTLPTSLP